MSMLPFLIAYLSQSQGSNIVMVSPSDPPEPKPERTIVTIWDEVSTAGTATKAELVKDWKPDPGPRSKRGQRRAKWGKR
jgi:hypothetical protein